MKIKEKALKSVAKLAVLSANVGANNACPGFIYQPKMPDKLKRDK
jgi:cyclic lactone autoinducer peptide